MGQQVAVSLRSNIRPGANLERSETAACPPHCRTFIVLETIAWKQRGAMPELNLLFPLDFLHGLAGLPLPRIARVDGDALPEPCRQLLVHDRDMTPTLSAFHGQEIDLRVLSHRIEGEVLFREVVLLAGATPVEFGAIAIHLSEFPPEPREAILEGKVPLGTILARHAVAHVSCPQAFVRVEPNVFLGEALGLGALPETLFGRRNILATPEGVVIADILEILPHGA
jgi:chorismate-pyruvate lyase